jgi:hypothetical protein
MNLRHNSNLVEHRGYVLIAVLIVIVVLSLAAYQFADVMSAEHRSAARVRNSVQARHNAVSGVHYAAAMLADRASFYGDLQGNPTAEDSFPNDGLSLADRNSRFALVAVVPTGNGNWEARYGAVVDEGGKLNINALIQADPSGEKLAAALTKLAEATGNPLLTAEVIDAIVDWLDPDEDQRANGAEASYYLALPGQYRAKNGPLNSLDELLLVRGVTPQLLYGNDHNRNGQADEETDTGAFDRGLADYLTVYGRELNLDAIGALRDNVNESEDMPGLYQRLSARLGSDMATFIMAYKTFQSVSTSTSMNNNQQNVQAGTASDLQASLQASLDAGTAVSKRRLKSLLDLRTARITVPRDPMAAPDAPTIVVTAPLSDPSKLAAMMGQLLDMSTTTTVVEMPPRINVNTAPREVLMTLTAPEIAGGTGSTGSAAGLTESDVDAIINLRANLNPADPATLTGAWMLQEGGISPDVFKKLEKYVTGRSMVFRIHSIGYFGDGGPVARVEAVVDTNQGAPRILYFRDLTDLDTPRGFEPPR